MIAKNDLVIIQMWVKGQEKALEWTAGDRTFQIMGICGAEGLYQRHFHQTGHPTRSNVGTEAMVIALNGATSQLRLYRGSKCDNSSERVSFYPNAEAALQAAKTWLGMPAEEPVSPVPV